MIAQHLHALLRAALPPEVPVLLPEQVQEPLTAAPTDAQGRPRVGGGERGLGAYLAQHAGGYVQIEEPQGLIGSLGGAAAQHLVQVAAIAPTSAAAQSLALDAIRACASRAGVQQTRYELTTPPSTRALSPGAYAATFILTAREGI
ncbi:hypothetical protein DM785_02230 [Deinococcus actinosclerus]|nr:hypothetical protein DM785_02230 [Deinococcus actinosclerus]